MRCGKCQSELGPDARFCSVCGHPVAEVDTLPLSLDLVTCPACDSKRPADERFCGECGQALQSVSPQTWIPMTSPPVARTERRRWPYALAVGIALLGGLGFTGYWFLLRYGYFSALGATAGIAMLGGLSFLVYRHFRKYGYFLALAASVGIVMLGGLGFVAYRFLLPEDDPFAYYLPDEDTPEERFLAAARMGRADAVKSFLADGMDPNLRSGPDEMTALMVAATFGETETVKALIAGGAEVNARMGAGWTALKWAAHGGHVETVKALIAAGADVNAKGYRGHTALIAARANGHAEVVRLLQEAGAEDSRLETDTEK